MAYGSAKGARIYANKVLGIEERLARLTDSRRDPDVPLRAVMSTWFWAMVKRLPSKEQVADLLKDKRWRKLMELEPEDGGSADTAGRVLDQLSIQELNELLLECFFEARRAGILQSGPYGLRCGIVDLNELFTSEKVHCPHCQTRKKTVTGPAGKLITVTEYFHQAVALVWASDEMVFPIGWELLAPGEGELTGAVRLLERLLPRLGNTLDLVMGDALYCCRPFFAAVLKHRGSGVNAFAICSGQTEMDEEMDLLIKEGPGRRLSSVDVAVWEMESEAWEADLKCKLRLLHYQRHYTAKAWKKERRALRFVTTLKLDVMPDGQGWKVGRYRWKIENGTFNILTRDYSLEHNFRHSPAAIVALLVLRSLAHCCTVAYRRHASSRSKDAPRDLLRWFKNVLEEDWVRYLDGALAPAVLSSG
jgi:hypothetical protein